jgi:HAE1 family hydrophobic/amphiphilic exporter-1
MNISAPFIKRPVMTTLVMIAIFICGIRSYYKLPVSDLPNVEHPSITVHANYNGAEPQTMVNLVTIPLEKELISVKGVKEISSKSNRGFTSIDLEFDFEQDMDEALRQVQTALNRAQGGLPSDLEHTPTYEKNVKAQMPIMFLVLTSPTASVTELREYSDLYLKPKLSRVEGVAAIETFGEEYSIKIKLDPAKMAAHKIGLNEVIDAIKSQNAEIPLGSIKTTSRVLSIEMQSGLKTPKDFENILIAEGPVRLKDIGSVTDETEDGVEFHFGNKKTKRI